MAINKNLLRRKIALHGDTQGNLAEYLGLSEPSMSQKINGIRDFSVGEIRAISQRYGLEPSEVTEVFFS